MQNKTEDADVVATTVRFPRALRHRLEDAARSSFRPLSGEIAHRIKLSFEQPDRPSRRARRALQSSDQAFVEQPPDEAAAS